MKKTIGLFICIFVLLNAGAEAADRDCYKLKKGEMVFVSVLHADGFVDLVTSKGNIANEYFNDLVSRNLAYQTNKELIVYKFDRFNSHSAVPVYRVKLQDGGTLGWVFGPLKKAKCN